MDDKLENVDQCHNRSKVVTIGVEESSQIGEKKELGMYLMSAQ